MNRFYIGSSILEPSERLEKHISNYYGNRKFTAKVKDWKLFLDISCSSIDQARKIENHIKSMKSRKYVLSLKKYPEIIEKLIIKYS